MKKFTFMTVALLFALVAFAAGPKRQFDTQLYVPAKATVQLGGQFNAKAAPKALAKKSMRKAAKANAPKKAIESAADLVGDYTWNYLQASDLSTDIESLQTTAGSAHVTITQSTENEGGLTISGMFEYPLEATLDTESEPGYSYLVIEEGQLAGTSSYGDYVLNGMFYFEGNQDYEAGWYSSDIYGFVADDGTITFEEWFCRVLSSGQYAGYDLTPYWVEGSTLTPSEPLAAVELPDGLEPESYMMLYAEKAGEAATNAVPVNVAVDGDDVYFQGISYYIPEAWVKGKMVGNTVTFPEMQYLGEYSSYASYAFYNGDAVFTYDAAADTYSAEGEIFGVLGDRYYDGHYFNPVLKKVVERAVMPADPAITALTESNSYGWYLSFNVPAVDVNGEGLVTSKLSYMLYTDVEGEIAPLTFTPDTHEMLEGDMTEIPYGFTENYDFYDTSIYLNDLFSDEWNNIGIQSIYRGGGEENATEIQWFHIKDYTVGTPTAGEVVFNFNEMNVKTSSNNSTDGDITTDKVINVGGVTLTISPKDEGATSPNRFWGTNGGPQLRVYSGTLTFSVPAGFLITEMDFTDKNKWNDGNTFDSGEFADDIWTGSAQQVVLSIAGNTQINKIYVVVAEDPNVNTFSFDDGTMQGWTSLDADGDGYDWAYTADLTGHDGNPGAVFSKSYENNVGALTPDNFLVSPKVKLDGSISFYACAQDASYPAEHFGVFVSTQGNTSADDFQSVEEWTLTASRAGNAANARGAFRSPRKVQGNWYKYTVDLSSYEGVEGYVAIRHFDCTDNFYIVVDDITLLTSWLEKPDYVITPEEGTVESLSSFQIKFNNYDVMAEGVQATLANGTTGTSQQGIVSAENNILTISFEETTEAGDYTLTITGVKDGEGNPVDLSFSYNIEEGMELLALPEGLETEEWTIEGTFTDSDGSSDIQRATEVAFDGDDIYVKGIPFYFEDSWMKGTIDQQTGIATFPSGQFVGEDEYGTEFMLGYGEDGVCDIEFAYDADAQTLTQITPSIVENGSSATELEPWGWWTDMVIFGGVIETVEVPEDLVTDAYLFKANEFVEEDVKDEEGNVIDTNVSWEEYTYQMQVGFDGKDVYFNGFSDNTAEFWAKGTLSDDGTTVTIPASQFLGELNILWYSFKYYLTAVDGDGNLTDIVLNYDAETNTFSTDQIVMLNESRTELNPYQIFSDVTISKMEEFAATPVDPEIVDYKIEATYPHVDLNIPCEDAEGNMLLKNKMFYQLFVVKENKIEPLTIEAALYQYLEEDMVMIPYTYDDSYDIYAGGDRFYLNQDASEIASWENFGVQSIYTGGGETHKSRVVWVDPFSTGITNVNANDRNAVIFDLQGRRVAQPVKGLYIMGGKKMVKK